MCPTTSRRVNLERPLPGNKAEVIRSEARVVEKQIFTKETPYFERKCIYFERKRVSLGNEPRRVTRTETAARRDLPLEQRQLKLRFSCVANRDGIQNSKGNGFLLSAGERDG